MTTAWKNRNERFNYSNGNGRGSFEEHAEHMREFRRSHADVAMVNAPRCNKAALLESMRPSPLRRTMMETGGSRLLNSTTVWLALVPMLRVARYKLSQN